MRLPVKLNLASLGENLVAVPKALAAKCKPRGWRASEYAMTKATAQRLWDSLTVNNYDIEADYFDWSCLVGELARFYKECRRKYVRKADMKHIDNAACALKVFSYVHTACMADPAVAALEAESRRYQQSRKKLEKYRKRVQAMERTFQQKELELKAAHAQLQRNEP